MTGAASDAVCKMREQALHHGYGILHRFRTETQICSVEVYREGLYQSMPPALEACMLAPAAVADAGSLPRGVAASCFLLAVSFASSESSAAQMSARESAALPCTG